MSIHFEREIEKLQEEILDLGNLVRENLDLALQAVTEGNTKICQLVVENDQQINTREIEVEEECLKILALHQPVASSLRYVIACLKINNDLERIGDLAVNIAQQTSTLTDDYKLVIDFTEMADLAKEMLRLSLNALVKMNLEDASKTIELEETLDALHVNNYGIIGSIAEEKPKRIQPLMRHIAISRYIERIGDHCTNIAEDVEYMINGKITRHQH